MDKLLELPASPRALLVLAHGAGAGMRHPFMESAAAALAERRIGTLRYEFPYMERGKGRPDPPSVAIARVREAVQMGQAQGLPLLAGGKSFGGRMTSMAQAEAPLEGVRGLVFFGWPLHPPGKPGTDRAAHLPLVKVPMLFLQGTRDEFAQLELLEPLIELLGPAATLHLVKGGDHSFKVSGRKPAPVMEELCVAVERWCDEVMR